MSESPIPKEVMDFAKVAHELCGGLERGLLGGADDVGLQLVRLHFCALRLPSLEPTDPCGPSPDVPPPHVDLSWLPDDMYWEVIDPFSMVPEEPAARSLGDDLLTLHEQLHRGLCLYDAGRIGEAWWDWRCGFYGDWGESLLGVQRALFLLGRR